MRTIAATILLSCSAAVAEPLSVTFRGSVPLANTTKDQNGVRFTVTGMSGLTYAPGRGSWLAVMDNSNKLVYLDVSLGPDGSIQSAQIVGGLSLDQSKDFEGITLIGAAPVVWLSEETTPAVREFNLFTGAFMAQLPLPPVFQNIRPNKGLESLSSAAGTTWTANEEALTVDGDVSTPDHGTVVRILRYDVATKSPKEQYAYNVDAMHGGNISGGGSGLCDLVFIPDYGMLALERSFAFNLGGFFRTRIYQADLAGATDVQSLAGLIGQSYTPATKTLLYEGDHANLEGLAVGPALAGGGIALLGIVDDGDPISTNTLIAFELRLPEPCYADCDSSGELDIDDFICFQNLYAIGQLGADCDESGELDIDDFICFQTAFGVGCP